ncbi:hypothetical protein C8Q80DRAFT_1179265 [Daedaleopsis nitida]|nr:hypothetical protein C8Q80DRAFT_1179265 [Daedaleopsis nitida]
MNKTKSKQTPQDLYREKKRREDEEKEATLPPGFINHGNTCFMNSTLQGLIATRPLHDLIYFQTLPQSLQPPHGPPILARRSPQLTNGHGLGGPDEREWAEGMPLGDVFTRVMRKAWESQEARRRESQSPKEILTIIGRQYDQYLDFRQQDAHEFLRHMLDAMRMEELDIIKKRQLPLPKAKEKRKRRPDSAVASPSLPCPALPLPETPSLPATSLSPDLNRPLPAEPIEEEKLESFVDMLFGGQLASILVCEKCKKVSIRHEDFNDLSLSIKPEDYVKGRKRDRIKKIARKLRIRPPAPGAADSSNGSGSGSGGRGMWRASSVPVSPVRRSSEVAVHEEEPPTSVEPRRKSFDHPGEEAEGRNLVRAMASSSSAPAGVQSAIAEDEEETRIGDNGAEADNGLKADDWTKVEAELAVADEKGRERKDKGDAWGKLARRISVSMKLSKDRDRDSRPSSRAGERGRKPEIKDAIRLVRAEPRSPRTGSLAPGASVHDPPSDTGETSDAGRTRASSPGISSRLPSVPMQRPSTSRRSSANPFKPRSHHHDGPTKSPVAPKMSEEDMAYLRRVLADIHPVTGNPLTILQSAFTGGSGAAGNAALATQALWAKLGHLPGIEECLRMFTAVEILDGENMVGCHRCWKIANGTYQPSTALDDDSDSESESSSDDSSSKSEQSAAKAPPKAPPGLGGGHDSSTSSPDLDSGRVSPASTSLVSTTRDHRFSTPDNMTAASTAPTAVSAPSSRPVSPPSHARKDSVLPASTFGGLPIPQISTTEPDTPESILANAPAMTRDALNRTWSSTRAVIGLSFSSDSLLTPKHRRRGRPKLKKDGVEDSGTSSDEDYDDSASDTSAPTSVCSDGSASPSVSPRSSVEKLSDHLPSPHSSPKLNGKPTARVQDRKIPRSKQVVPRRMYKRYLISTPPPILVVHLKRFQQTAKHHAVSLSGGFKKLDEFVAFPEYLDLAPFLAPKREECTHDQLEREKERRKSKQPPERCMYRLYAVVVHIGNMLGGHYVAYTALPASTPSSASGTPSSESEKPVPPLPSTASASDLRTSYSTDSQRPVRQWAYISDTVVKLTTLEEVLKAKAYICMYERV